MTTSTSTLTITTLPVGTGLRNFGSFLALTALAEIALRNPNRVEGADFSFSRRDRGVGFALAEKFLTGEALGAEDVLSAVTLAFRYRKQLAALLPSAPEATIDTSVVQFVDF